MNIKQIITVGVAGMAMGAMALDNVEVTDVRARQRYPWNGKVDIDFTLDSKPTEPYQMQVEVYDNIGKTNLPVKSVCTEGVSIEANPCMVRTDTRRIVWDAAKDLPNGFKCTNVLVTCRDARTFAVSNLYCVIDLQTGAKTYLDKIPVGGWTDEHKTTKMVFRRIESGSFVMGSPVDEVGRQSNETQRKVTITKPYYIAVFELTEAQYANIMQSNLNNNTLPRRLSFEDARGAELGWGVNLYETGYVWPRSSNVAPESLIGILRQRTSLNSIDLPTEAQWERAARADTVSAVNIGGESSDEVMRQAGRYDGNKTDGRGDAGSATITTVGCYQPNAYGLYDCMGNAREWCRDAWVETLGEEPVVDPVGDASPTYHQTAVGSDWTYAIYRVARGGGFYRLYQKPSSGSSSESEQSAAELTSCRSASRTYSLSCVSGSSCLREGVRLMFDAE